MARDYPVIVVADKKGKIYDFRPIEAVGMKAGHFYRLNSSELIRLPYGSELLMLPQRMPVGFNRRNQRFVALNKFFAVACFVSPGYTITYNSAYRPNLEAKMLPLFSYGAACFYRGKFYVTALRVDRELRQDLRLMPMNLVKKNVRVYRKLFPHNRLVRHLQGCALEYACPAAKNFFLSRYEAPLPTAPYCNARCLGCISYQDQAPKKCSPTQPRIKFFPSAEEVAEVALHHIKHVPDPVVSFGQGCEGEPLLAAQVIEQAIKLIRRQTTKGLINMNTNASIPQLISRLFAAGLDSIRVSLNSAQQDYYQRYYRPKGYQYKDVLESMKLAKKNGGFVSLNYLVMPGFTDSPNEFRAFKELISNCKIDMVQWRNLNFDPLRYFQDLKMSPEPAKLLGIRQMVRSLQQSFPHLMFGYFNPAKGRIRRLCK